MKNFLKKHYELSLLALLLCFDLVSKALIYGKDILIWDGVFVIKSVANTGAAFSIFSNQTLFLILVSSLFLIGFVVFHARFESKTNLYRVAFALTMAGAIGNYIDRIFLGYVRDFFYVELINFPIFNIADACLTIGVGLLALFIVLQEVAAYRKQKEGKA